MYIPRKAHPLRAYIIELPGLLALLLVATAIIVVIP